MKSTSLAHPRQPVPSANDVVRLADRRREELAFLPAALEIVETPPSPVGRVVGFTLIALFCAALAWSWWGSIDIVASATGKIVPSIRTKVIQPFETGVVRAIRVQDGQTLVTDGPFADTKEIFAGFYLIEADDLDQATELATRIPAARIGGSVEIRPVVPPPAQ